MSLSRFIPYVAVVLRLAVGLVFLHHGWGKLHNFAAVTDMIHGIGFPFASVFAAIVTGVETLGAVCVILGVLTRIWAALMAFEIVVAILTVVLPHGGVPEVEGLLFAGSLALIALGDGPLSIGGALKKGRD